MQSTTRTIRFFVLGAIAVSISQQASADAIIPYMVVPWGQLFLLPVVVLLEAIILRLMLGGTVKSNLVQSFLANLASTAIGAVTYVVTSPIFGNAAFHWWFKGEYSTESIRSALIASAFAAVLWFVSWVSESFVIVRMRRGTSARPIISACAVANVVTYSSLLALAIWFGRGQNDTMIEESIDRTRNSHNIASLLAKNPEYPFVGFWKNNCENDFGLAIEAAGEGRYTVIFCGPGACDRRGSRPPISLQDHPHYRIIDANAIEERPEGSQLHRCSAHE